MAKLKSALKVKPTPQPSDGSSPRTNTRQRIVLRSITLFNRYGVHTVTIDRISADLKISPGNLTYYFPRKDELIHAAVELLKERLREALQRPVAVDSASDGAAYLIRVFRTFWDFRFYFNALAFLLTEDATLRREYDEFRDWLIETMESDIYYLAERGHFRPVIPPNTFRLLSENIYGLLLSWLRAQQIQNPRAPTPSASALREVALHLWSLCQHWMNAAFAQELLIVFKQQLAEPRQPQTKG